MTASNIAAQQQRPPAKGERGFGLDMHLTFAQVLPREQALELLRAFPALTAELYARHDQPEEVPSARLMGTVPDDAAQFRSRLGALLEGGLVRAAEVGVRGFLRSAEGYTEWMPWRRNVPVRGVEAIALREGEKYVLDDLF